MKKMITTVSALALCMTMSFPVMAASADQTTTDSIGTTFEMTLKNDPTYTITIPESVSIAKEGTKVNIVADNVAYLDNKEIQVTIGGTDYYRNQMVLQYRDENYKSYTNRYQIESAYGELIETTGGKDQANGKVLAKFTEDGTVSYTVKPVMDMNTKMDIPYSGTMTYGIQLVDKE